MANPRICSVSDCHNPVIHRGWCQAHYNRWKRHGDPLAGGKLRHKYGPVCTHHGCDQPHYGNGYCQCHYLRHKRHGSPLAQTRPANGEAHKYLCQTVLVYDGDDCLLWPFNRNPGGYGQVWHAGSLRLVSRVVCEATHGAPPTPNHVAAHSCGKGHEGCCTKRHLSWRTSAENNAEMVAHGTAPRGSRHGLAKLTEDDVRAIRSMRGSHRVQSIASSFNVTPSTIFAIFAGRSWSWLI